MKLFHFNFNALEDGIGKRVGLKKGKSGLLAFCKEYRGEYET